MDGGMLSQEEINALLAGVDNGSGDSSSAADSTAASDDEQFLTEEQKDIMQQIAEYIINDGAITVMELNETDTELWKRAVKSFGGATLASEIKTLSKFILKVA